MVKRTTSVIRADTVKSDSYQHRFRSPTKSENKLG